jgi:lipid-A-disaccharide synthase
LKIFLVAGEESGDRLGGALMAAIAAAAPGPVVFEGVGGAAMAERGLVSRFPIDELAINGFVAIPARLPAIVRRIRETAAAVVTVRPDVLVIIDSPDFTHRVARRVRAAAPDIPIVDYVSPTVWAWRPGRATAMRAYVDHVLALLPFEPEVHQRLGGPPCTFVGHPLTEAAVTLRPGAEDRARREVVPPVVLVLPGSRAGELNRLLATFAAAIGLVMSRLGTAEIVVPTVPHLFERITRETASWRVAPRVIVEPAQKWAAFREARAALAASGTVTLELALAQVPTVIAYKVSIVDELILRALVTAPHFGLANLVLGEEAMPELLQRQASPARLAEALLGVIGDTPARGRQLAAFARLDRVMEVGAVSPSTRAAAVVIEQAQRSMRFHPAAQNANHRSPTEPPPSP